MRLSNLDSTAQHATITMAETIELNALYPEELNDLITALGEKPFRARQIFEWLHIHHANSTEEMTNLPRTLRVRLEEKAFMSTMIPVAVQTSKEDGTQKYLFETGDGHCVESVRMVYRYGVSVCVSTQIGCRMGCTFCASTMDGLVRGLTAGEMLQQVYRIHEMTGQRVSHVVVMGMGEPFDNYDQVIRFLRLLTAEPGYHMSARSITVSTCGIVPGIRAFAKEGLPVTLALSLHAPEQALRERMMPVAKAYPLDEVMEACDFYFHETGRRVTVEYALAQGVNDTPQCAGRLGKLLKGRAFHVNLISVNPVRGRAYVQSSSGALLRFKNQLENYGINVTIRRELGRDIDGACGQLRKKYKDSRKV